MAVYKVASTRSSVIVERVRAKEADFEASLSYSSFSLVTTWYLTHMKFDCFESSRSLLPAEERNTKDPFSSFTITGIGRFDSDSPS